MDAEHEPGSCSRQNPDSLIVLYLEVLCPPLLFRSFDQGSADFPSRNLGRAATRRQSKSTKMPPAPTEGESQLKTVKKKAEGSGFGVYGSFCGCVLHGLLLRLCGSGAWALEKFVSLP